MLNLLATLVVSALPAPPGAYSACPEPTPPAQVEAGECGQAAPLDLWYRMSRFAEPDPGSAGAGTGTGSTRRAQANHGAPTCEAPRAPAQVSSPNLPPVALFTLPTLLPLHVPSHFDADARDLPARAIAPPERPPRA